MELAIKGEPKEVAKFCREFQEKKTEPRVYSEGYSTIASGDTSHAESRTDTFPHIPSHG